MNNINNSKYSGFQKQKRMGVVSVNGKKFPPNFLKYVKSTPILHCCNCNRDNNYLSQFFLFSLKRISTYRI